MQRPYLLINTFGFLQCQTTFSLFLKVECLLLQIADAPADCIAYLTDTICPTLYLYRTRSTLANRHLALVQAV